MKLTLTLTLLTALLLVPLGGRSTAVEPARPLIGAFRWDAWHPVGAPLARAAAGEDVKLTETQPDDTERMGRRHVGKHGPHGNIGDLRRNAERIGEAVGRRRITG